MKSYYKKSLSIYRSLKDEFLEPFQNYKKYKIVLYLITTFSFIAFFAGIIIIIIGEIYQNLLYCYTGIVCLIMSLIFSLAIKFVLYSILSTYMILKRDERRIFNYNISYISKGIYFIRLRIANLFILPFLYLIFSFIDFTIILSLLYFHFQVISLEIVYALYSTYISSIIFEFFRIAIPKGNEALITNISLNFPKKIFDSNKLFNRVEIFRSRISAFLSFFSFLFISATTTLIAFNWIEEIKRYYLNIRSNSLEFVFVIVCIVISVFCLFIVFIILNFLRRHKLVYKHFMNNPIIPYTEIENEVIQDEERRFFWIVFCISISCLMPFILGIALMSLGLLLIALITFGLFMTLLWVLYCSNLQLTEAEKDYELMKYKKEYTKNNLQNINIRNIGVIQMLDESNKTITIGLKLDANQTLNDYIDVIETFNPNEMIGENWTSIMFYYACENNFQLYQLLYTVIVKLRKNNQNQIPYTFIGLDRLGGELVALRELEREKKILYENPIKYWRRNTITRKTKEKLKIDIEK